MRLPNPENAVVGLIDRHHEDIHRDDWKSRPYFEVSALGQACDRYLWLHYRRAVTEPWPGRMLRLVRRGQREEETIVSDLTAAGVDLAHYGDDQTEVSFGPLRGHIDALVNGGIPEAPKELAIAEFKTYNLRRFEELEKKGLQEQEPRYYVQVQCYMRMVSATGPKRNRCLFVAVCKDDDRMHVERIPLDPVFADSQLERGKGIALSEEIPPRISEKPDWYACKYCAMHDFCHLTHAMSAERVCCRNCANVTVHENGDFYCEKYGAAVPPGKQFNEYPCHVLNPQLAPFILDHDRSGDFVAAYRIGGETCLNGEGHETSRSILEAPHGGD